MVTRGNMRGPWGVGTAGCLDCGLLCKTVLGFDCIELPSYAHAHTLEGVNDEIGMTSGGCTNVIYFGFDVTP